MEKVGSMESTLSRGYRTSRRIPHWNCKRLDVLDGFDGETDNAI